MRRSRTLRSFDRDVPSEVKRTSADEFTYLLTYRDRRPENPWRESESRPLDADYVTSDELLSEGLRRRVSFPVSRWTATSFRSRTATNVQIRILASKPIVRLRA